LHPNSSEQPVRCVIASVSRLGVTSCLHQAHSGISHGFSYFRIPFRCLNMASSRPSVISNRVLGSGLPRALTVGAAPVRYIAHQFDDARRRT
jgi:hypothetical protein